MPVDGVIANEKGEVLALWSSFAFETQRELEQVMRIPISDFELSARSRNCLERAGIELGAVEAALLHGRPALPDRAVVTIEVLEADKRPGNVVRPLMRQHKADEMTAASRHDGNQVLAVLPEVFLLKRIDLIADDADIFHRSSPWLSCSPHRGAKGEPQSYSRRNVDTSVTIEL